MGISLTKKVKDLYNQNYSVLKKEIEQDARRLTGRIDTVNLSILSKILHRVKEVSIEMPTTFLTELEKQP